MRNYLIELETIGASIGKFYLDRNNDKLEGIADLRKQDNNYPYPKPIMMFNHKTKRTSFLTISGNYSQDISVNGSDITAPWINPFELNLVIDEAKNCYHCKHYQEHETNNTFSCFLQEGENTFNNHLSGALGCSQHQPKTIKKAFFTYKDEDGDILLRTVALTKQEAIEYCEGKETDLISWPANINETFEV